MFTRVFCRRRSAFTALKCKTYASTIGETMEHSRTAYGIVRSAKLSVCTPFGIRRFGSSTDVSYLLTESEFHLIADETLEELIGYLDMLESSSDDFEVEYSSGVLNISMTSKDISWVINKQTPNRQLWWSSPLSGPRRYEWIGEKRKGAGTETQTQTQTQKEGHQHQHQHSISQWVSSRDSVSASATSASSSDLEGSKRPNLFDTLRSELLQVSGLDIKQ